MPEWKRGVGRALDAVVKRAVPEVKMAVRWNSPFYGVEGQGWFLSYHCFKKYVKVTFLNGAALRPLPPIELKAPHARCWHVHEGDELDEERLESWIRQAAALPGERVF